MKTIRIPADLRILEPTVHLWRGDTLELTPKDDGRGAKLPSILVLEADGYRPVEIDQSVKWRLIRADRDREFGR